MNEAAGIRVFEQIHRRMQVVLSLFAMGLLASCAAGDSSPFEPVVRSADSEPRIDFPGHPMHEVIKRADSAAAISLFEVTVPPRTSGPPPHVHTHEDEYFIVLEGELRILNGDEIMSAGPGTVASLTRGYQHTFWNNTDLPVRYLLGIAPGDFASFFDEVVMDIQRSGASNAAEIAAIIGRKAAERDVTLFPENMPAEQAALMAGPQEP